MVSPFAAARLLQRESGSYRRALRGGARELRDLILNPFPRNQDGIKPEIPTFGACARAWCAYSFVPSSLRRLTADFEF